MNAAAISQELATQNQESYGQPVDLVHLSRQTMGDTNLEKELLGLFILQVENYRNGLSHDGNRRHLSEIAHQLKGSARSIGAWKLAEFSQIIEDNPMNHEVMAGLKSEIDCVETYINSMVQ